MQNGKKVVIMLIGVSISSFCLTLLLGFLKLNYGFIGFLGAVISGFWGLHLIQRSTTELNTPIKKIIAFTLIAIVNFVFFWALMLLFLLSLYLLDIYRG